MLQQKKSFVNPIKKRVSIQTFMAEGFCKTIFYNLKNCDVVVKTKNGKSISGILDDYHPAHGNIILKNVGGISDKMMVIRDDWVSITGKKKPRDYNYKPIECQSHITNETKSFSNK